MVINISVELERMNGKFISKAELAAEIADMLEGFGTVQVDESEYEILAVNPC